MLRVLVLGSLAALAAGDCSAATAAAVAQCYQPFLQFFNMSLTPNGMLPDDQSLQNAISDFINARGAASITPFCNAVNARAACLNATVHEAIDVDCMTRLTGNMSDSYAYMEERAVKDYECNAGNAELRRDLFCMESVVQHNAADIVACQNQLQHDITNNVPVCKAYDKYISCYSVIFARKCDYNAGVFYCNDSVYNVCDNTGSLTPCPNYRGGEQFSRLLLTGRVW